MSARRIVASPGTLLRQYGLAPKKSWGQNFLHDERVHRFLAEQVSEIGSPAIEIGAGLGTLTGHLLAAGTRVTAIERDRELCRVLREELSGESKLQIHEADAVRFDYGADWARGWTIVGNLPYQLTGPLLFRLLKFHDRLGPWIVMVQKEVGDRLCADPGTKVYGGATVTLSRVRAITRIRRVSRGAFLPAPRVDSSILRFDPLPTPRGVVGDPEAFRALVQTVFQRRRKTMLNALGSFAPRERVLAWCADANVDPGTRPETLPPERFAALQRAREASGDA
ncbi:MAG: 16S rRNA (adenine(1518)-N(6)/adenine(1519)-N(6))-dimethyltransferase RsmA [Nannocystaceae bacterium]